MPKHKFINPIWWVRTLSLSLYGCHHKGQGGCASVEHLACGIPSITREKCTYHIHVKIILIITELYDLKQFIYFCTSCQNKKQYFQNCKYQPGDQKLCVSNFKNIRNSLQKLNIALRRLRKKDGYKFKAALGYRVRGTLCQKSWRRGQDSSMDKGTCCQTWWSEFDLKSTWWTERTNSFQLPSDLHTYTCKKKCNLHLF